MALHLLRLPSPPHPRSKPFIPSWRPSLPSPPSFCRLGGGSRPFAPLAARASSSPPAVSEDKKAAAGVADRRRLIAQNIPWDCTAEDVRALFERHGTVLDVELSMFNKTKNRGLAFITMSSEEEATAALNNLNSYDMDGRIINLHYARSKKKSSSDVTEITSQRYTVYVGNLAWRVRSQDLREFFSANGEVISAQIIYQTKPRRPAGYGFVSFSSREEAEAAVSALNGKGFMGRPIRLALGKSLVGAVEGTEGSNKTLDEVNTN